MRSFNDYKHATRLLKYLYVNEIVVSRQSEDLKTILKQHDKLVIVMNHGPMMGALAGLIGLADSMQKMEGLHRRPFGITWRNFYKYPLTKQILTFLTQIDHGVGFEEAMSLLSGTIFSDCVIMPEGELCNFGDGVSVQEFLSPRFVELAVRNQMPVLIAVHQGSEQWARPIQLPPQLLPLLQWLPSHMKDALNQSKTLSLPKLIKPKLGTLRMSFTLYQPNLSLESLSEDPDVRRSQLEDEAKQVRSLMQSKIKQLKHERNINALVAK